MYKIIGADGREYGPVSAEQLREWLNQGRVNAQTQIQPEGTGNWQALGALPEFAGELTTHSAAPPPAPGGPVKAKTSGMAIASLVLGILGLVSCGATALIGLVLGIVAMVKIKNSEGRLSGNGLAIAGTVVSGVFLLLIPIQAAMLLPALAKAKERAQTINCVNHVKQLALAVRIYASDNEDRFPSADNWCDAIRSEAGTDKVFQCPSDPNLRCAFAYNRKLDGLSEDEIHPQTVLFFESDAGWNAAGGPELFSPHQHSRTSVIVGFADGSVQQLSRAKFESLRWDP
ncbi:MAG: DUF4190 domain-containing protein [Verrucomicrobiae bacterium]|nr:DUF4190 domain-containing protein [Verrucomicrobiae bacterium]